jgi:hypothetical protein
MQRPEVAIDDRMIRHPPAHHQVGAQQRRHLGGGALEVRLGPPELAEAEYRGRLDARQPAARREVPVGCKSAKASR